MITKTEARGLLEEVLDAMGEAHGALPEELFGANDKLIKIRDEFLKLLPEEVAAPVEESVAEPIEEAAPIVEPTPAEERPEERRTVYKSTDNEDWVQVEGISTLVPGDVFYMREATGEIVKDRDGCEVFVAIGHPRPTVNENNVATTGIEVEQDPRFHINAVPVHTPKKENE